VFVDESKSSAAVIAANLQATRLAGGRVVCSEVLRFLARDRGVYDLVLADPPYARSVGGRDLAAALVADTALPGRLAAGGLLVVEVATEQASPAGGAWRLLDRRTYGGCAILLYERVEGP
jgi:16S rRNA (guanine966-N2)-methyltransferase